VLVKNLLVVAFVMAICSHAEAAPAADLVVVWAPGHDITPIAAAARRRDVALIDRSPTIAKATSIDATIQSGIEAYDALKLDTAWSRFEEARTQLDASGGAGVTSSRLSDLFVYRALVRTQQADTEGSWDELVEAVVVAPSRVFDPARFPPRVLAEIERARTATAATGVTLAFDAPDECRLVVDGTPRAARELSLLRGTHWVHAICVNAAPWGRRIDVSATERVRVIAVPFTPPSETELLVQARAAGTRGLVIVEVHGTIGVVRLLGVDGAERARRTRTITGSLAPLASAIDDVLASRTQHRWYQSRWTWAAGGALVLAAVLIPTLLIVNDDPPTGVRVVGPKEAP
jgi:hypothetical protein